MVAEGRWASDNPDITVHFVPLEPNAVKVWIDVLEVDIQLVHWGWVMVLLILLMSWIFNLLPCRCDYCNLSTSGKFINETNL